MSGQSYLRKASYEDLNFLFELVNDKECRKNSFKSDYIEYEEHKNWFYNKLISPCCDLYIYINENNECVGQVRLDIVQDKAYISYSILNSFRYKGHGKNIIKLIENEAKSNKNIRFLIAKVKKDNVASKKIFSQLNYKELPNKDNIDFIKEI